MKMWLSGKDDALTIMRSDTGDFGIGITTKNKNTYIALSPSFMPDDSDEFDHNEPDVKYNGNVDDYIKEYCGKYIENMSKERNRGLSYRDMVDSTDCYVDIEYGYGTEYSTSIAGELLGSACLDMMCKHIENIYLGKYDEKIDGGSITYKNSSRFW